MNRGAWRCRRPGRAALVLGVVAIASVALAVEVEPASAHAAFESSRPVDGATVDESVPEIEIVFTAAVTPAGEGFVILDPGGVVRQPDDISAGPDQRVWTLRFDPPLVGGEVGVRWSVQAPDTHPISGAFTFSAGDAPAPDPSPNTADTSDASPPSATSSASAAPSTPTSSTPTSATPTSSSTASSTSSSSSDPTDGSDLDAFLDGPRAGPRLAGGIGAAGRLIGYAGAVLSVGGLAFAATAARHRRPDREAVLALAGLAALAATIGAAIELLAQGAVAGPGWTAALTADGVGSVIGSSFGLAVALRALAGLTIVVLARRAGTAAALSAAAAVLLVSFTFDGHTVTEGNRWLTGVVDVAHVAAASVWGGGVAALAVVLWKRHRAGRPLDGTELAIRFSVVAGVALAAAGLAGVALTVVILDEVADLWATPWGRALLAKVAAVVAAAAIGAYNHFAVVAKLVPGSADDGPSDRGPNQLRATVSVEAALVLTIVALTAVLVGSSAHP